MTAILQVAGAILLLAGFVAAQVGALRDTSLPYLTINMAGAACLAVLAMLAHDWGFLLLEGSWAGISAAGALRACHRTHPSSSQRALPASNDPADHTASPGQEPQCEPETTQRQPTLLATARPAGGWRRGRQQLPPARVAQFAGDELSQPSRLIHLFRDSYAGAHGRQWLQPHILWWILTFLRRRGVVPDWNTLASPMLAQTIISLGLPAGHTTVHPSDQTAMNFGLWWPLLTELTRRAYRPRALRLVPNPGHQLPDATQLTDRAGQLGLRPWMSSATFEEISGIARALACIPTHDRQGHLADDDFMVHTLLPELLIVELHWLHAPGGRPRAANRTTVEVTLHSRYENAVAKWAQGKYLTPLDHMYLRAGDILHHLSSQPDRQAHPALRRIMFLYDELQHAQIRAGPTAPPQGGQ